MPRKQVSNTGELPLPAGWEVGTDFDGKRFFIDHTTKQTTWIDPRDRLTKPMSFADCVGDELPYGWEQAYDPQVGIYFVDHVNETTQLEDPRLQWRETQERMLSDYLAHAREDLMAKKEIYSVKQERLAIAQEEVSHLQMLNDKWKTSKTSLNSTTSISSKYDPDLLKADVEMAKKRVARLKQELQQIHTDVWYKEKGLDTLSIVQQKMTGERSRYTVEQAHQILNQINDLRKSVCINEQEKRQLLQGLVKLKEEVLMARAQNGSSPDVSTLSIPRERLSTASQTDLAWEGVNTENRWGEIARMRLQYEEAKKQVRSLQEQLAEVEEKMIPGQPESDRDRLMLIQEKEQLLRELRGKNPDSLDPEKRSDLQARINQLEKDLAAALHMSTRQIDERLRLNETKSEILKKLAEATHLTSYLESELKSLSVSTLSVSSGSSRSSLGSLSASSKGSLNSLSFTDLYTYSPTYPDVNLPELHRRVEKVLQGHNTSLQAAPGAGISPIIEVDTPVETLNAPIVSSTISLAPNTSQPAPSHHMTRLFNEVSLRNSLSPGSSLSSLSSPPMSPYNVGPPPSYQQHVEKQRNVPTSASYIPDQPGSLSQVVEAGGMNCDGSNQMAATSLARYGQLSAQTVSQISSCPAALHHVTQVLPLSQSSTDSDMYGTNLTGYRNSATMPETDNVANPPLSPISESSSGVCNNASGVNTRSVSAAVSDESVAGDSGVFEASSKRSAELDDVLDMSLESAQVQIELQYDQVESQLCVGIEQARNLMALTIPEKCHVCIKATLLPSSTPTVFTTRVMSEVNNPKFSEQCKISVPANKLMSKTLQVQVWCVLDGEEECMGGAQVSLAAFDPEKVKTEWYNVLSFKFMQSESGMSKAKLSEQPSKQSLGLNQPPSSSGSPGPVSGKMDIVSPIIEMSSVRPRRSSLGEEKLSQVEVVKDSRMRSLSFDSSCFRSFGQGAVAFSSLKEESSDESTIISSQTSTLTRNQGPDDMLDAPLGHNEEDNEDEDEEEELSDEGGDDGKDIEKVETPRKADVKTEQSASQNESQERVTCDKETNTEVKCTIKSSTRKSAASASAVAARNSMIRRSQTFSPMGKISTPEYICKLNRSDSDSSVRNKKPFQRNAAERRSVRFRKMLPPLGKSHSLTSFDRLRSVTSVDLELDLQAYQARLSQLHDEIARLKEITKKFEEAKVKGETEPNWFTDNEQLQHFMVETDKALTTGEAKSSSKVEEKAARLMKQATREAHRLRRSRNMNEPDPLAFRAKMAYLTTLSLKVPAIQDPEADVKSVRQSSQHHRHAHSDPLRGVSQTELKQVIAGSGQQQGSNSHQAVHGAQTVSLSLPQPVASQVQSISPVTASLQTQSMKIAVAHSQNNQMHLTQKQAATVPTAQTPNVPLSILPSQTTQIPVSQMLELQLTMQQPLSEVHSVPSGQNVCSPSANAVPTTVDCQNIQWAVQKSHCTPVTIAPLPNVPLTVPHTSNVPVGVLHPARLPQNVGQPQAMAITPQQCMGLPEQSHLIRRPVAQLQQGPSSHQLPNTVQSTLQQTSTTTGQRRAHSFNEGADRTRAANVHVPVREHSFSHARSSNEKPTRVHSIGEHPLAQTRRLQLGTQPLVPATEEQQV